MRRSKPREKKGILFRKLPPKKIRKSKSQIEIEVRKLEAKLVKRLVAVRLDCESSGLPFLHVLCLSGFIFNTKVRPFLKEQSCEGQEDDNA